MKLPYWHYESSNSADHHAATEKVTHIQSCWSMYGVCCRKLGNCWRGSCTMEVNMVSLVPNDQLSQN